MEKFHYNSQKYAIHKLRYILSCGLPGTLTASSLSAQLIAALSAVLSSSLSATELSESTLIDAIVTFLFSCLRAAHLFSLSFDTQRVGEGHPSGYLTNYKGVFVYKISVIILHTSFTLHSNFIQLCCNSQQYIVGTRYNCLYQCFEQKKKKKKKKKRYFQWKNSIITAKNMPFISIGMFSYG